MKSLFAFIFLCVATGGVFAHGYFDHSHPDEDVFSDEELTALGQAYAKAINERDEDTLNLLVAPRQVAKRIADLVADSDDEHKQILEAYSQVMPTVNNRQLTEIERQDGFAEFIRVHEFAGVRGPLVRLAVGGGYNYTLLLAERGGRGNQAIKYGDIYYSTTGEWLSESIGIATKMLTSPSEAFLRRVFGGKDIDKDLARVFRQIGELRQQNRLTEAFELIDGIESDARNHRLVLMNSTQLASQIDEDLYRKELGRLAAHHKDDPRVAFTLLDYYFYENDVPSAMDIIDGMEQTWGEDGVMNMFRANLEVTRGRFEQALAYARTAVDLEPGNEDMYWTLLTVLVQSEDFPESVSVLETLEGDFGYEFAQVDFESEPLYERFRQSPEFLEWIDN